MNNNDREIEIKMEAIGVTLEELDSKFRLLYYTGDKIQTHGQGKDVFWYPAGIAGDTADFVRLREDGERCELTVKAKDKGDNLDRMEKNVAVLTSWEDTKSLMINVLGNPLGEVEKKYIVYNDVESGVIVCLYQVLGDEDRVFMEVEGPDFILVDEMARDIQDSFREYGGVVLYRNFESLYEMFIEG